MTPARAGRDTEAWLAKSPVTEDVLRSGLVVRVDRAGSLSKVVRAVEGDRVRLASVETGRASTVRLDVLLRDYEVVGD
jgi:hypothetical protein